MTPMQQILLGVGAKKKTYMDDVFSTYVYKGNASARSINNGVDLSGEGGMVWSKCRTDTFSHALMDTERGTGHYIRSEDSAGQRTDATVITAFNNNGYSLGADVNYSVANKNNDDYSSWSFRKAPGFFDVVTYTGTGSSRTVAHSLGCIPGMIMVKRTDTTENWRVYHREVGNASALYLNTASTAFSSGTTWDSTNPTSTHFTVNHNATNANGGTFLAYVFAGGESTAATARSVEFDGSGDYLSLGSSSDVTFGTGDFTIECWVSTDAIQGGFFTISDTAGGMTTSSTNVISVGITSGGGLEFANNGSYVSTPDNLIFKGVWTHVAMVRASGVRKIYVNGTEVKSVTDTYNYTASHLGIGTYYDTNYMLNGKISNFRVVKGTAVYTSSFKPLTEPLTNITNTKILCCNNSSITGSTVTFGTISSNGNPAASSDSPFDDPAAFTFGDSKEGIIKCGSYVGNGNADGPEINLGWEPQWIIYKCIDAEEHWLIRDSLRGIGAGTIMDPSLTPSTTSSESNGNRIELTPTGFRLTSSHADSNNSGDKYVYVAIRRPDGYVGKPADAGTGVFTMDAGASSSTIPNFDSGFPVDFAMYRRINATDDWVTSARLIAKKKLYTNNTDTEVTDNGNTYDSNVGWNQNSNANTNYQAWMFKRHAGFDVVTYKGNGVEGRQLRHNLEQSPQMIWIKSRSSAYAWQVWHKDLTSGKHLYLNNSDAETNSNTPGLGTVSSVSFNIGSTVAVNQNNNDHIALLFASVDGISKVGSYTGTDSNPGPTITTGFQPRFIMIKSRTASGNWNVFDSTRGINSSSGGVDQDIWLNLTNAQDNTHDLVSVSSTGFTLNVAYSGTNAGYGYIYYAHA